MPTRFQRPSIRPLVLRAARRSIVRSISLAVLPPSLPARPAAPRAARDPTSPDLTRPRPTDLAQVQCGDPNCAPIDTIVRLIFPNECGTVFGVPCEAHEVEEEDILSMMPPDEYFAKWAAGEKAEWPLPPEPPDPGEIPDVELRFKVGDRVQCCIARGPDGWAPGVVVSLWYRAPMWPTGQYAPYQVRSFVFTLVPIRPTAFARRDAAPRGLRPAGASLRPGSLAAFDPDTPRRLSTPTDAPLNSTPTSQIKLDGHDSLIFAPQDKDNCIKACP